VSQVCLCHATLLEVSLVVFSGDCYIEKFLIFIINLSLCHLNLLV
jgi:hypothetical protein